MRCTVPRIHSTIPRDKLIPCCLHANRVKINSVDESSLSRRASSVHGRVVSLKTQHPAKPLRAKSLLTRSSTHLSNSLLLLNSHRSPVLVIAYVESAISPRPQATSTKSLFLCSPNMADRPIKGTGSLYCATKFPLSPPSRYRSTSPPASSSDHPLSFFLFYFPYDSPVQNYFSIDQGTVETRDRVPFGQRRHVNI